MSIFPKDIEEAAKKMGGQWIKAEEFESSPVLQIAKPMEVMKSNNPKYGADDKNYLVKQEILELGETFHYTFNTPEGDVRTIDSNSPALFIGMKQVEELGVGDWVRITRTGKTDQTRYTVEKIDAPELSQNESPSERMARTGERYDVAEADRLSEANPFK